MRAKFYVWEVTYYIQIDPRYQNDPQWRRAADYALYFSGRVPEFALEHRLIQQIPWWFQWIPFLIFGGMALEVLLILTWKALAG